jgi:hypothetical protein
LYTAQIKFSSSRDIGTDRASRKCGDLLFFVISASATVSSSQLSLKFTFSPMRVFARLIKHSLNVSVQRPEHADARMHREIAAFGDVDQAASW